MNFFVRLIHLQISYVWESQDCRCRYNFTILSRNLMRRWCVWKCPFFFQKIPYIVKNQQMQHTNSEVVQYTHLLSTMRKSIVVQKQLFAALLHVLRSSRMNLIQSDHSRVQEFCAFLIADYTRYTWHVLIISPQCMFNFKRICYSNLFHIPNRTFQVGNSNVRTPNAPWSRPRRRHRQHKILQ